MKYIILVTNEEKLGIRRQWSFVFPERLVHADVAKSMIHCIGFDYDYVPEVLSAGFCQIDNHDYHCHHGSESLGLKSNPTLNHRDAELLNQPAALQGMIT